jgi:protein-disulfide isomerase
MRRYLPFAIVGLVAFLAVASGTLLYRTHRPQTAAKRIVGSAVGVEIGTTAHVRGAANAIVTLEEFGDFQCPACAKLADALSSLEQEYKNQLRIVFRHLPLPGHQHAREAAVAAEAAGLQGRFWQMHDLLYRERDNWAQSSDVRAPFNQYAANLGLDLHRFGESINGDEAQKRVAADIQKAAELGVTSTPAVFLNGRPIPATQLNAPGLRRAINEALETSPTR